MLQKATLGRDGFWRVGSNQPKPREERAQTAQGATGLRMAGHAACSRPGAVALSTSARMAPRLKRKVSSAEALYRVRL